MERRYILVIMMVLLVIGVHGQESSDTTSAPASTFNPTLLMANTSVLADLNLLPTTTTIAQSAPSSVMVRQPSLLPTAFFCKIEHKLDKNTRVPLRFRLGDVDYTDAIEGKNRFDVSTFTKAQRQQN